tara:strand:- start:305 stop:670 length:366 start_codon:yes stop_codon:yes gene_type:complete
MSETLFKEEAVHAYPDGWTCVHCGDEYSEKTTDVEDFYVINTDEGTLCLGCFELENSTLSCTNCGSLLIGEQPAIELPYCSACPDKDKIQELLMIITDELWGFIPEDHRKIVDSNLKQLGL